jgi:hypothetical protein
MNEPRYGWVMVALAAAAIAFAFPPFPKGFRAVSPTPA